jgi:glycosyltransferase involved in cell wall biosynthesis
VKPARPIHSANSNLRVLIAAFVNTDHPGVLRKVHEQTVALREHVPNTIGVAIGDNSRQVPVRDLACAYVHVPGGAYSAISRAACFHVLWEVVQKVKPDIVYFRYPMYDSHVLRLVREVPGIVFEVQTKAESELSPAAAATDNSYAQQVLPQSRAIVAVTDEILTYEMNRGRASRPGYVMSNGMNAESVQFTPHMPSGETTVELVCAAQYAPWHGIDRVLAGMAMADEVTRNGVLLHLAGEGEIVASYKRFVDEFGLAKHVRFHGRLSAEQLAPLFERSHVAIGSLALHRIGLRQLAVLKNREYCLRGIPFVFAGEDVDFPSDLPFVSTLPANDDPIPLTALREFAQRTSAQPTLRQDARAYGEHQLAWRNKMKGLASFLGSLTD